MELKAHLKQLLERWESEIEASDYAWIDESDRFAELIVCLLNQCNQLDVEVNRTVASHLKELGLLDVETLSGMDVAGSESAVVVAYILKKYGFSEHDAQQAIRLLARVGHVIRDSYGGRLQRYLRNQGEMMRDQMVQAFACDSLDQKELRFAISHFLQDALSLPISLEHQAVLDFCSEHKASLKDLFSAADELERSIAYVDDVLDREQKAKQEIAKQAEGDR